MINSVEFAQWFASKLPDAAARQKHAGEEVDDRIDLDDGIFCFARECGDTVEVIVHLEDDVIIDWLTIGQARGPVEDRNALFERAMSQAQDKLSAWERAARR